MREAAVPQGVDPPQTTVAATAEDKSAARAPDPAASIADTTGAAAVRVAAVAGAAVISVLATHAKKEEPATAPASFAAVATRTKERMIDDTSRFISHGPVRRIPTCFAAMAARSASDLCSERRDCQSISSAKASSRAVSRRTPVEDIV